MFGVVTIDQGSEVRVAGQEVTFAHVGTLASIEAFDAVQPSLFMIRCKGQQRFRVIKTTKQSNGLWIADVELIDKDPFTEIPNELLATADALRKTMAAILEQTSPEEDLAIFEPYKFNDCTWVANRWAELLPLPPEQKQHLMSMDNPRVRLDLVTEVLQELGVIDS